MATGITVVTHTNSKHKRDISKCVESVAIALPPNSRHLIIELDAIGNEFQRARHAAMSLGEIVVLVDDDDYISPDSLKSCLRALNETNAGIAHTYEVMVRPDGSHTCNTNRVNYEMLSAHPQVIHQMCVIRTSYVTNRSLDTALNYGAGVEWFMKAESALFGNAIQVPIKGYYWVQHAQQRHRTPAWQNGFRENLKNMTNEIKSWSSRTGAIPLWQDKTT
jgi:hypothetical protein